MIAHKDPKLPALVLVPEGSEWVAALKALGPDAAQTLFAATRTLYPHDALPDRVYRRVVAAFDRLAETSPQVAGLVADCVALLDAKFPVRFRDLSESYRVTALESIEGTPGFRFLQRGTVRYLYDDVEVWAAFGYQGASFHLGGYVERGFNDLGWLPDITPAP